MARAHQINVVDFLKCSFKMHSIENNWGLDDVVVAELRRDQYAELQAMAWWIAMCQ